MKPAMGQLRNRKTGHIVGDPTPGKVYWTQGVNPTLSTPCTRGTEFPIDHCWKEYVKDPNLEILMPDGRWWNF